MRLSSESPKAGGGSISACCGHRVSLGTIVCIYQLYKEGDGMIDGKF